MSLEARLNDDLKVAMKARAMEEVYVLRGLITAIKTVKVEKMVQELPDVDVVGLVRKEINKRNEAIEFARKANRPETVDSNQREQLVLEKYAPAQMDAAALEQAIRAIATELGSPQLGAIMAQLKERFPGQYDGKLASQLARQLAGA